MRLIRKMKISSESGVTDEDDNMGIGTQVAMVGATMPSSLKQVLGDVVPLDSLVKVTTPHLHRLMPHIPQKFIRIGSDQKPEALLKALKSNSSRRVPTLVFCNRSSTACYVGHFLNDNGIANVVLHAQMPQKVREGRFEQFQNAETEVLVCTDIMSRGMDTVRAKHVINFDFPHFISDYIHRSGRIGRVGSSGTGFVLSFISYKWDVDLLWKIEASARRATEFHNVNANIKRKLTGIIQEKYTADNNTVGDNVVNSHWLPDPHLLVGLYQEFHTNPTQTISRLSANFPATIGSQELGIGN
ncbi:putative ATP-dependent RNA helicase DDX28 [Lamellibrachia satsuma]|nr:putative ATP-dependent RNA helicase DDX28 [Lamellibrachia satsuma]